MMTAKMGERDSREEIMKAFRLFDDDQTGEGCQLYGCEAASGHCTCKQQAYPGHTAWDLPHHLGIAGKP
jgi:Ni,Fe-hydrogenase I small subunit